MARVAAAQMSVGVVVVGAGGGGDFWVRVGFLHGSKFQHIDTVVPTPLPLRAETSHAVIAVTARSGGCSPPQLQGHRVPNHQMSSLWGMPHAIHPSLARFVPP